MPPPKNRFALPYWAALLSCLVVFAGIEALLHSLSEERRLQTEARAATFTNGVDAHATSELNKIIYLSSGLSAYLSTNHIAPDEREIYAMLAALKKESPYIRNFGIAIGTRLKYVYPLAGNEKVVGLDYRSLPAQWPSIARIVASHQPELVGPIDLVQGGAGFVFRKPIVIDGNYWGILSTVVEVDSFTKASFGNIHHPMFDFAVRNKGPHPAVIWGDPKFFDDKDNLRFASATRTPDWEYAIHIRDDAVAEAQAWILHAAALLVSLAIGGLLFYLLNHRAELQRTALYDALTGLPNRRLLMDRFHVSLARAKREAKSTAVLFLDLNGFKAVNDTYGHKAGDAVLVAVGQRISGELRATDTLARLGGDEFVIVLETAGEQVLARLVERLRASIAQPIPAAQAELHVRAAIGIATTAADGEDPERLLSLADERMYADKERLKGAGQTAS